MENYWKTKQQGHRNQEKWLEHAPPLEELTPSSQQPHRAQFAPPSFTSQFHSQLFSEGGTTCRNSGSDRVSFASGHQHSHPGDEEGVRPVQTSRGMQCDTEVKKGKQHRIQALQRSPQRSHGATVLALREVWSGRNHRQSRDVVDSREGRC